MCRHCDNLTEDKQIVHDFMAVAAKRLSEIHDKPISPDDLDVNVTLTIRQYGIADPKCRVRKLLNDLSKETGAGFS
jgi:hypothetical protein